MSRWYVGLFVGDGVFTEIFVAYAGFKLRADGSWGSYRKVLGPFANLAAAKQAEREIAAQVVS